MNSSQWHTCFCVSVTFFSLCLQMNSKVLILKNQFYKHVKALHRHGPLFCSHVSQLKKHITCFFNCFPLCHREDMEDYPVTNEDFVFKWLYFTHSREGSCSFINNEQGFGYDKISVAEHVKNVFLNMSILPHLLAQNAMVHCKGTGFLQFLLCSVCTNSRKSLSCVRALWEVVRQHIYSIFITLLSLDGVWDWTDTTVCFIFFHLALETNRGSIKFVSSGDFCLQVFNKQP